MNDYTKLTEITVKTQQELDEIPLDFKGRIFIEFGTAWEPAVVRNNYCRRVVARGNSSVEASANAQVLDRLDGGRIEITGNARIVYMPKTIHEFMDFYGVKHNKKKATFYKAVHKDGEIYFSDHNNNFVYRIGKTTEEQCDTNTKRECSFGVHIAHLDWALNFGREWGDLAILEVETDISDIVMPEGTDGKVRTCKCKVLREVPLSECGVFGKILEKRKKG
jgi:hypothetical protein